MPQIQTDKNLGRQDEAYSWNGQLVTKVIVHAGEIVDGMQLVYGTVEGEACGGRGGTRHEIVLHEGEHITTVKGQYGFVSTYYSGRSTVSRLAFITNKGRTFGPYGGREIWSHGESGRDEFEFSPKNGQILVGVSANSDRYLNTLSCYFSGLGTLKDWCCRTITDSVTDQTKIDQLPLPGKLCDDLKEFGGNS